MSDLIRREDVMALWEGYHPYIATKAVEFDRVLRQLPSAEPKAVPGIRRGYWEEYTKIVIPHPYNHYEQAWKCSECGYDEGFLAWNYCPNCGAKMEADHD